MNGKELKKLRLAARMTQRGLADILGLHQMTVFGWERDGDKPLRPVNETAVRKIFGKVKS
jgi:transcriptional regulator with XRE-family HTH domain